MEASVKLGRIAGIPVGLHISWFLIFGLVTWSLAVGYFPTEYPSLSTAAAWGLGAVTSLLFFGSVLAHEISHSLVAVRNQIPVRGITLFIFGGVAQIEREPRDAGAEFRIAVAGPLTSLLLGLGFGVIWWIGQSNPYLAAPSVWLMRINLILAAFNMIPGFPLDGGRVLRAIIWRITGSFQSATNVATITGQITAMGFIGIGLFIMLSGNLFNGLWMVFIGWFLQNAAASSYAQATLQQSLRGVTVSQVMTRDCPLVPAQMSLAQLVDEQILTGGRRCFFVADEEDPHGMLTLADVTRVPKKDWDQTTLAKVMKSWEHTVQVQPDTALLEALQRMDDANINQVPVVHEGKMVGMLSREQLLHYIRTRAELGM